MSEYANLRFEVEAGTATIVIDRPESLNALDRRTIEELGAAVDEVCANDAIRGALITGAGSKSFVAGADIHELSAISPLAALELSRLGQGIFRKIELSRKVFIAAVNGFALGGGCELALACHLRLASAEARFGFPEVRLGIIPGYGGTVRLPRLVGTGRALEMILTGTMIDAEEAYRIGLVNRVLPSESLMREARELLATILANGPVAVGLAIESATRSLDGSIDDGLALESNLFALLAATEDLREGTSAFLEKREARFGGR